MTKQAKETMETIRAIALWLSAPAMMIWTIFNGYPSDLVSGFITGAGTAIITITMVKLIKKEKENHNGKVCMQRLRLCV